MGRGEADEKRVTSAHSRELVGIPGPSAKREYVLKVLVISIKGVVFKLGLTNMIGNKEISPSSNAAALWSAMSSGQRC